MVNRSLLHNNFIKKGLIASFYVYTNCIFSMYLHEKKILTCLINLKSIGLKYDKKHLLNNGAQNDNTFFQMALSSFYCSFMGLVQYWMSYSYSR